METHNFHHYKITLKNSLHSNNLSARSVDLKVAAVDNLPTGATTGKVLRADSLAI